VAEFCAALVGVEGLIFFDSKVRGRRPDSDEVDGVGDLVDQRCREGGGAEVLGGRCGWSRAGEGADWVEMLRKEGEMLMTVLMPRKFKVVRTCVCGL